MHSVQQARIDHPKTFIIALASPRHHALLRKLGADEVFDYSSTPVVDEVRKLGRDVRRAIDCHSEGRSTVMAAECMLPDDEPGNCSANDRRRLIRTLPPSMSSGTVPQSVRADEWILSYTALGKVFFPLVYVGVLTLCLYDKSSHFGSFSSITLQYPMTISTRRLISRNLRAYWMRGKSCPFLTV